MMGSSNNEGESYSIDASSHQCNPHRKGLIRFLNFAVNHPVLKDDGVLSVFLTEPDFDGWKRRTTISYDEEALTKRIDRMEEMSIPSDLEEKLAYV